jgi:hypothetical protein
MSDIAQQAEIVRRELREMEEQSGVDSAEVQQMRAVALEWIAELQEEQRLAGIVPGSKTA